MKKTATLTLILAALSVFAKQDALTDAAQKFFEAKNNLALTAAGIKTQAAAADGGDTAIIEKTKNFLVFQSYRCPVCEGKKPFIVYEPDKGQLKGKIKASALKGEHRVICPVCKGKGRLSGYREIPDMMRAFAEGRTQFEAEHRAKSEELLGRAFVPANETLTPKQMAAVSTAFGVSCRSCGWSGVERCRECSNKGVVKCERPKCRGTGWIIEKDATSTSKTKKPPTVKMCETCRGTGEVICPECDGKRGVPCEKCKGQGLGALCRKCQGNGLMTDKDGEEVLCRTCKGIGRRGN